MELRVDSIPTSGHYAYVHCRPDGTPFYVGKGSRRRVKIGAHRNRAHANCVAKYGAENIHVRIYPQDSEDMAFALEIRLIQEFNRAGFKLYNLADGGRGGTSGVKMSTESSQKKSRALKGIPLKPEHAKKIADALRGNTFSEQARENISIGQKKRFESKEECMRATEALRIHVRTPEEIERRSASLKAAWARKKLNASQACTKEKQNG